MTANVQDNTPQEQQVSNKELNFRNLEAKYQKQLQDERSARIELERQLQERSRAPVQEEDDESEPYVDHKRLEKKIANSETRVIQQAQTEIQKAVKIAIREERKENWIKNNSDFYNVLEHADKLALHDPDLAESILEMPESFERQKLVYKNIKALKLHEDPKKQPTIQEKVDANRKSPFYQGNSVGAAPYSSQSDFSASGQKNAYDKMQELKRTLRL